MADFPFNAPLPTTIAPSDQLSKVVDIGGQVFNVKGFGAKGDGVTDDTAAIQAAITAASPAGVVFFPEGTYKVTSMLNATAGGVTLQGINHWPQWAVGGGSVIAPSGFTTGNVIELGSSCAVRNLAINATSAMTTGNIIYASAVNNILIESVSANNSCGGLSFVGCSYVRLVDVEIPAGFTSGSGIAFTGGGGNLFLHDCNVHGASGQINFLFSTTGTLVMVGVQSNGSPDYGLHLQSHTDAWIYGFQTNGGGSYQVYIDGSTDIRFFGLYGEIAAPQQVYIANASADVEIVGATLSNATVNAILVDTSTGTVGPVRIIGGNINGSAGSGAAIQISGNAASLSITNAIITAASGQDSIADASTNSGRDAIYANNIVNQPISITTASSGVRVKNNSGYNPTGPQTAPAIPASGTAYANPFPFDCAVYVTGGTVTAVAIGGTATGLTSGQFFVPAGETITLTYTAAPTWTWFGN